VRAFARIVPACAMLVVAAAPARAVERVVRTYDERDGLAVSEVHDIAQDAHGFIWIGTTGGLFRFDGHEMRLWAANELRHVIRFIATSPHGDVVVGALDEPLHRVTATGVDPVIDAQGRPVTDWVHAAFGPDGSLWIVRPSELLRCDAHGRWSSFPALTFDMSGLYTAHPVAADTVLVGTRTALFRLVPGQRPVRIAPLARVNLVAREPSGSFAILTRDGALWRLSGDQPTLLFQGDAHGRGLAVRGDVIWASIDQYVLAFRPGRAPERVAPFPWLPTGRPIIVDREGTLWIGGYRGIMALPEPATVTWNQSDGLPAPTHSRTVARSPDAVWVNTWYGAARLHTDGGRRVEPFGNYSGGFFPDAAGGMWDARVEKGFERWLNGRVTFFPHPGVHGIFAASDGRNGRLWLATEDGPFLATAAPRAPRLVAAPPPARWGHDWTDLDLGAVLEDRHGRLWVGCGTDIASADAESLAAGARVAWRVDTLPTSDGVAAIVQLSNGDLWAGTGSAGVWRWNGHGWSPLRGNQRLPSLRIYDVALAPSGGVWVLACGSILRVAEQLEASGDWKVLERLTTWQGMPNQQASDIHEDPDGRLWLATLAGLVEIPPAARHMQPAPPRVEVVDLLADDRALPMDGSAMLPFRRNRVEMRFAALSFRDPTLLRYRVRVREGAPWLAVHEPSVRFVDLAPGSYRLEVEASLDGRNWTAMPASIAFRVRRPWWLEWWALAALAVLVGCALLAAHRIRVGVLLRLERQRTRIAMDLHDEMGSGLGSIGLLAGVAAGDRVDDSTRRRIAAEIAEAAGDLGGALSDIVWSLREGADTLSALARRLAERGRRLFPNDAPALALVFPDPWPEVRLTPEVRRNLQLMALEALHNAARHACACHVELGFEKEPGAWRLWVRDDGRGVPAAVLDGRAGGHGVRNLRQRAAAIGARFAIATAPNGGTCITVHFDPAGRRIADSTTTTDMPASGSPHPSGNGVTIANGEVASASHHHANPPEPVELP